MKKTKLMTRGRAEPGSRLLRPNWIPAFAGMTASIGYIAAPGEESA